MARNTRATWRDDVIVPIQQSELPEIERWATRVLEDADSWADRVEASAKRTLWAVELTQALDRVAHAVKHVESLTKAIQEAK